MNGAVEIINTDAGEYQVKINGIDISELVTGIDISIGPFEWPEVTITTISKYIDVVYDIADRSIKVTGSSDDTI